MDPDEEMQSLRPEYTPGDLGFDPLGMASEGRGRHAVDEEQGAQQRQARDDRPRHTLQMTSGRSEAMSFSSIV